MVDFGQHYINNNFQNARIIFDEKPDDCISKNA